MFAEVILPLALPKRSYTYRIPDDLLDAVRPGVRVEVPFGKNKLYSGIVESLQPTQPEYRVRDINAVLDEVAVVNPQQLQLWDWIASYYCCSLGEVMAAALPGHLKLTSETRLVENPAYGDDFTELDSEEYLLAEALHLQHEITIEDARKILNKKTIFPVVQRLLNKGVLFLREDLQQKFKPRTTVAVRLAEPYRSAPELLQEAFKTIQKFDRQTEVLMAFTLLSRQQSFVRKKELLDKAQASDSSLQSLVKKAILETYEREVSRLPGYDEGFEEAGKLNDQQVTALSAIQKTFAEKQVALLHGVTGSGKTRVYIELIRETLLQGGQVLYLLPEIALTTQIVGRLQRVFGADIAVYHSKINYNERVEVWKSAAAGKPVILGARSGLFLPFQNLRLIIVDEEHDSSFKQFDPAPRYNARDTAVYLAHIYQAKVLLGTATPSLESYHNVQTGKYGLAEMSERFGEGELPAVELLDLRPYYKAKQMQGLFSPPLLEAMKKCLENGEQVILFQNRRGYSPILECQLCSWTAMCKHCEVSLTYHQHNHKLRCHYCGYVEETPSVCPACGSGKVSLLGFGTEKIEDELKIFLPEAKVARLDMDTAGSKSGLTAILQSFEEKQVDILVGTQMVTKGLDFENVGLVGVIRADSMLKFPDFRAGERSFQLLTQVAGRAGRKNNRGKVIIQALDPKHPILQEVLQYDFQGFLQREMHERHDFSYPPFFRLIYITVEHKDLATAQRAAAFIGRHLREQFGDRLLGPVVPSIPRLRGLFGQSMMLKLEKSNPIIHAAKDTLHRLSDHTNAQKGWGQVKISINVDPM